MKLKRFVDVTLASLILVIALPILLCCTVLVRLNFGSPVLFRQMRPGLHGSLFELIKFRSMLELRGYDDNILADELRLTKFGKILRSTSLDELPSLINVLRGDMSLVGPRPLLPEYMPLYNAVQRRRHEVKPGITGWAQVQGRNAISWERKFELDIWYVDNRSFILDCKILTKTMLRVLRREDITWQDHVTTTKFQGSNEVKTSKNNRYS